MSEEFNDRMFNLIHGLPVPEKPDERLASDEFGFTAPSPMAKFAEQMQFDAAMGKRSAPVEDFPLRELFLKARDSRDELVPAITLRSGDFSKRFGEPIAPQPGGDLFKRFNPAADEDDSDPRRIVTKFSTGDVIALLDERGVVTKTYFQPRG